MARCRFKDKKTESDCGDSVWKDLFQMRFYICLCLIFCKYLGTRGISMDDTHSQWRKMKRKNILFVNDELGLRRRSHCEVGSVTRTCHTNTSLHCLCHSNKVKHKYKKNAKTNTNEHKCIIFLNIFQLYPTEHLRVWVCEGAHPGSMHQAWPSGHENVTVKVTGKWVKNVVRGEVGGEICGASAWPTP